MPSSPAALPPTTLDEALHWLKGDPLTFGGKDDSPASLFVLRPDNPLKRLRQHLLRLEEPLKYLVAGHRGTGKSTEINHLLAEVAIASRFRVVALSAQRSLDIYQWGRKDEGRSEAHIDVLLAVAAAIHEQAVLPDRLPLEGEEVAELVSMCRTIDERVRAKTSGGSVDVEIGAGLPWLTLFFASFKTRLRSEVQTSSTLREVVGPDLARFLRALESYVGGVQRGLASLDPPRRLLVVVEDLDKIPSVEGALALFRDGGTFLARPPFAALYTLPISLVYSQSLAAIRGPFADCVVLSAVRTRQQVEGAGPMEFQPYPEGAGVLDSFLRKRVGDTFTAEARERCCEFSGGVFSQLQRLAEAAALEALSREATRVSVEDVDAAIIHLRAELDRPLSTLADGFALLDGVDREHGLHGDEHLWMLHALQVLEYQNGERWVEVNPLLRLPLERWRRRAQPTRGA